MKLTEKMSYLKGLLDGLEIDTTTKEGKLLIQMTEVMQEMVNCVDDLQTQVDDLTELCDILDSDLGDVEEDLYDFDDCDCDDCCDDDDEDEEEFEVECPLCNTPFTVDAETALNGTVPCPNCGEMLEFEVEEAEDDE